MTSENTSAGYGYAIAAYLFWGFAPVYFVWVGFAAPLEILSQRILWSVPFLAVLVLIGRQWPALTKLDARTLRILLVCALLLGVNWLTFIYGISQEKIAETSLGYFINPLVSIVLGTLLLGEHLRIGQWVAVGLAALGVLYEVLTAGVFPWIALLLALTFGVYGLLRKQIVVPAAVGLGVESLFLFPLAAFYLIAAELPQRSAADFAALALGGAVTVVPLVWFGAAANRLRLSTLGFIQYLAPSLSLLIAVWFYQEALSPARWLCFAMVWVSIVLLSLESLIYSRKRKAVAQL